MEHALVFLQIKRIHEARISAAQDSCVYGGMGHSFAGYDRKISKASTVQINDSV